MESQSVFQAETQAKIFSIELPPCLFVVDDAATPVWRQLSSAREDVTVTVDEAHVLIGSELERQGGLRPRAGAVASQVDRFSGVQEGAKVLRGVAAKDHEDVFLQVLICCLG